jgi:hypothetical protein
VTVYQRIRSTWKTKKCQSVKNNKGKVQIVKRAFITQLIKQEIIFNEEQFDRYFHDFIQYCEEMEFTSEEEILEGAGEYIACQIHYGLIR